MKKYGKLLFKITVSGALFYFLFSRNNISDIIRHFDDLNLIYMPFVALFLILNYVFGAFRWKALLIYENTEDISVGYLSTLYFIGSFFNNFMPSSIGGDVYKFVKLGNKIGSVAHGFSSTFMERFTGVIVLFLITLMSFPLVFAEIVKLPYLSSEITSSKITAFIISLVLFVLFLVGLKVAFYLLEIASARIPKLKKIYSSISEYRGKNKVIYTALATSVFVQLLSVFTQYFIFLALGVKIPIFYALTVFPAIALISFLPISLNGMGVQDGLYSYFFGLIGISSEIALGASLIYHLSRLVISLIGGVLYAMGKDS